MTKPVTIYKPNSVFSDLHSELKNLMGRNLWMKDFEHLWNSGSMDFINEPSFPKYNMIKDGDDIKIEIALAGYKKDELAVELSSENVLTVSSSKIVKLDKSEDDPTYIHKGVAARDFTISWKLSPWGKVGDISFEDGMLQIEIKGKPPDKPKTKLLDIK